MNGKEKVALLKAEAAIEQIRENYFLLRNRVNKLEVAQKKKAEAAPSTSTNKAMLKCCQHHTANKGCAFFPAEHNCGNRPCIALRHS